jgi:hypothetical protein
MSKYTYKIEYLYCNNWRKVFEAPFHYCLGYIYAIKNYSPRNAHRVIRSDGLVMDEVNQSDDVGVGMVAGYPTAEQYEFAAEQALNRAKAIRAKNAAKTGSR